jgi:hypothetical protein
MAFNNPAISRGSSRRCGRRTTPGTTAPTCHDLPLNSSAITSVLSCPILLKNGVAEAV